jgi:hypothetical protein
MIRELDAPPGAPCDCPLTVLVLDHLGAEHAAQMHGNKDDEWNGIDWILHIEEEERFFFPLAEQVAPIEVAILRADHVVFRAEIMNYGRIVSLERLAAHAATEDRLAKKLVDMRLVRL